MDMNEADRRLMEAIHGANSEGTPLGLAFATGALFLTNLLIMLLGFVLLAIVTWMISFDGFFDDVSFISYQGLFAWVVGAYASYFYKTNSTIEKWTDRGLNGVGMVFAIFVMVLFVAGVVLVLSKIFGFEIPKFENPFNIFN
jgi:hypothetical protein